MSDFVEGGKMSKRILTVFMAMSVLATSNAFASRARELVLGTGDAGVIQGTGGSAGMFYTDGAYNMFYNPAYVNDYKNWAIIEKTNGTAGAQGGFVTGMGSLTLGVFMNRQDDMNHTTYTGGNTAMRPLEALIGGDMNNVKWGLGVSYATETVADPSNATQTKNNSDVVLRGGISVGGLEPFIDWRISGTDNGLTAAPSNKGETFGARYHFGEWVPYAVYSSSKLADVTTSKAYGAGFGRTMKASEAAKLMYGVSYFRETIADRAVVPFNVAVEAEAASWLTLRAGLAYNFMDRTAGKTIADNTTGRVGATAHAGKAEIDWAVGNALGGSLIGDPRNGGTSSIVVPNSDEENLDSKTVSAAQGLFTALSVAYHW